MGATYRHRYSVQLLIEQGSVTPAGWQVRPAPSRGIRWAHGRPTVENLLIYVEGHNEALKPGGVNAHLGPGARAYGAYITDHDTNRRVAEVHIQQRGNL